AAAIVDDDARSVRKHKVVRAVEHVLVDRAAERPVEDWQRRHLLAELRPEAEDAAADEEDAVAGRRVGLLADEHLLDLALKALCIKCRGDRQPNGQQGRESHPAAMNLHNGYPTSIVV